MRLRSVLVLLALAAGCVDPEPRYLAKRPLIARFETGGEATPQFLDVPFPSDAYLQNGRFANIPGLERTFKRGSEHLKGQLAQLNGWSRIAGAMFVIDDKTKPENPETLLPGTIALDRASLPANEDACKADASSVFLLDLDATDPAEVRVPCRAIFHDETMVENGRSHLAVGPARGIVLEEGRHYLAVITSRLRDVNGRTVFASEDFVATAVRKEGPLGALYGAAYDKAMANLGGALGADTIVALAPYTTQKITDELYALRDQLEAAPTPTLAWDAASLAPMGAVKFAQKDNGNLPAGFTASLDDWLGVVPQDKKLPDGSDDPDESLPVRAHDKIAAIGTAMFEATNWLQVKPTKYDDVAHGTFARDPSGNPIPSSDKPKNKIWVTFAIPTAPMPANGYPAVIVQHGLSGSRAYLLALANRLCSMGFAAVAIDSLTFGARANDPKFQVDATTDYVGRPGVTYNGPDGISDLVGTTVLERAGSFDLFGGLKNIAALRDQLRQAELDTAQLVKLLRSKPDLAPLATTATAPVIDGEKIAYVGDSLGGIEGAVAAAIEPHVKAWFLNVAGGGLLTEVAAHGPTINAQLSLGGALNFGFLGGQYTEAHPMVLIGQALAEGGDPIAYADKIVKRPMPLAGAPTKPRNVLQIEVLYDEIVANEGNEALARAGGWLLATPHAGTNSGLADLGSKSAYIGGGIKIDEVSPDATGFHDTPVPGVTALFAQVSPAQHGSDLVRSKANRTYEIPYNTKEGGLVVDRRNQPVEIPCPYRELQAVMTSFFNDAFEGRVPVVTNLPAPTRDLDNDGATDDVDREPVDPATK